MTTFTELVAVVLVQSSAAAYGHFGVTLEPARMERPPGAERTVARIAPKAAAQNPDRTAPRASTAGS